MIDRRRDGRGFIRNLMPTLSSVHPSDSQPPIGLVAGWGSFPIEVAQQIHASGRRICCIAITDHASHELESICDDVKWSGVGKFGAHVRYFRRHGVRQVTMAGKLFKSELLFKGSLLFKHCPDWTAICTFAPHLLGSRRDSRDDSLLLAVTKTYANRSLTVCPATDFAPELLVNQGILIGKSLSAKQARDAELGWQVAKQMGGLDIGQSVTIKDGTVLSVEAVEGTDECIARTGNLCPRGGWTLVKVSKPNQDMRFDVPTIGPHTITGLAKNGGTAIVVEADKTILVEREKTLQLAKQHGITIVAFHEPSQLVQPKPVSAA